MVDQQTQTETESRWYVIHTYSGYEDRVKKNLDQRVMTMDVKDKIFDVVVPTEDEIDEAKCKVKVLLSFFGRETPVELDFLQIEKL